MSPAERLPQIVLIFTFLPLSWYGMMAVHELGHVIGGVIGGGRVLLVRLPLLGFSETVVDTPRPLVERAAGPVVGALLPVAGWGVMQLLQWPGRMLARWFAGFCLIANGAYLGVGWIIRAGDAGDLMFLGAPVAALIAFGMLTTALGLLLWHNSGRAFGLGDKPTPVSPRAALGSTLLLLAIVTVYALTP
jgi:hypothetical protein